MLDFLVNVSPPKIQTQVSGCSFLFKSTVYIINKKDGVGIIQEVTKYDKELPKRHGNLLGFNKIVLELLKVNPLQKYVIEKTKKQKSHISRSIKFLIDNGYIEKLDRGYFKVTNHRHIEPSYQDLDKEYWRLHNLMVFIRVNSDTHKLIKNTILKDKLSYYVKDAHNGGNYFHVEDVQVIITHDNIFIHYPDDWEARFKTKDDLINGLYDIIKQSCIKLENRFKVVFFKDGRLNFNIRQIHIAYVKDQLVKEFKEQDINGVIVKDNDDGKVRFLIDWSHTIPEVECVHTEKAIDDAEKWRKLLDHVKNNELEKLFDEQADMKMLIKMNTLLVRNLYKSEESQPKEDDDLSEFRRYTG